MTCKHCLNPIAVDSRTCPHCGEDVGFPNVRDACRLEEVTALAARREQVCNTATADGAVETLARFEQTVNATSHAVVCLDADVLIAFLQNSKVSYATYGRLINAGARLAADDRNDKRRRGVEGTIFGSYGEEIRYAALSLDGWGLRSYGDCHVRLKTDLIARRASLTERNTYSLVKDYAILAGAPVPAGIRADWDRRGTLAMVKHGPELVSKASAQPAGGQAGSGTNASEEAAWARVLMMDSGDRQRDEFLEVHIYGSLTAETFDGVAVPGVGPSHRHRETLKEIKEHLFTRGIPWQQR